jgi:hypothetical protein
VGERVGSAQDSHKYVKMPREKFLWPANTHIYRDTPSNRAVGQIKGAPDAPTPMHRTHPTASGAPVATTCLCSFKDQQSIHQLPDVSDACAQHPMRFSKGPEPVLTHRARPTARHEELHEAADVTISQDA